MQIARVRGAIASVLVWCLPTLAYAQADKVIWSIWWHSDLSECARWNDPMIATHEPCDVRGVQVSICPHAEKRETPYDQGKPITIVGWQLVQLLTAPTAQGVMIIGSANGTDGADVFAITGGTGTNRNGSPFPQGTGLPQGAIPGKLIAAAHLDIYGQCDKGKQQAFVVIYYTSP